MKKKGNTHSAGTEGIEPIYAQDWAEKPDWRVAIGSEQKHWICPEPGCSQPNAMQRGECISCGIIPDEKISPKFIKGRFGMKG